MIWLIYAHKSNEIEYIYNQHHPIEKISMYDVSVIVDRDDINIKINGEKKEYPDACIFKVGTINAKITEYAISILEVLEHHNVKLLNSSHVTRMLSSKFNNAIFLRKNNIPTPDTVLFEKFHIPEVQYPIILKMNQGSHGKGVMIVNDKLQLEDIMNLHTYTSIKYMDSYVLQEYVKNSHGRDIRVMVVGDEILGCMLRKNDRLQSNANLGGIGYYYECDDTIRKIVNDIKTALPNLNYAGIDLLITNDPNVPYLVSEINVNPGFTEFQKIHPSINVAEKIISFLL